MHRLTLLSSIIFAALAMAPITRADLHFDKPIQEFHPDASARQVVAHFTFTNTDTKPVTITDLESNCGCTTAAITKKTYAPNEKGEIVATFEVGQRVGFQDRQITVITDDPDADATVLGMKIYLPDYVEVRPRMLAWTVGDKPSPRSIAITVSGGQSVHVTRVSVVPLDAPPRMKDPPPTTIPTTAPAASDEDFDAVAERRADGVGYDVRVTPKDLTQPCSRAIRIETDFPTDDPRTYRVLATVYPAAAKTP